MLVLRNPGLYHWRSGGEQHINDPLSIANLQVRLLLRDIQMLFSFSVMFETTFSIAWKKVIFCQLEKVSSLFLLQACNQN